MELYMIDPQATNEGSANSHVATKQMLALLDYYGVTKQVEPCMHGNYAEHVDYSRTGTDCYGYIDWRWCKGSNDND